jgi:hypothetical protein
MSDRPPEPSDLESALDTLYGGAPSDFVAIRKQLAETLRASGQTDAAKALVAARRPTKSAWALNQVVRREPDLLDRFLTRTQELADAQRDAITGKSGSLRDATRAQRMALEDVIGAAMKVLSAGATDAQRSEIAGTLQAAMTDASLQDELHAGRLTHARSGASGFLADAAPATTPPTRRARPSRAPEKSHDDDDGRAELEAAERGEATAAAALEGREAELTRARQQVRSLEAELAAAREQERAALAARSDARRAHANAARKAEQAARRRKGR